MWKITYILEELNYNRQLNGQPDAMSGGYGNVAMNQMMNQWGPVMGPLLADPSMMMQYQVNESFLKSKTFALKQLNC